jgi:hypothetical protein
VAALASALGAALSELAEYTDAAVAAGTVPAGYVAPAGNDPKPDGWDDVETDLYAHARRTAGAELCCALGLVGHRACRSDAVDAALAALEALLPVLAAPREPGCAFRADGLWNSQTRPGLSFCVAIRCHSVRATCMRLEVWYVMDLCPAISKRIVAVPCTGTPNDIYFKRARRRMMAAWPASRNNQIRTTAGTASPGRSNHSNTTLYISLVILHTQHTGRRRNDFNVYA